MRGVARLAVVLVALVALAGCSAIPITGPVTTAAPQGATQPDPQVFTPGKPTPGALPADVIRNFLNAATGPQDDYRIAREYLAPAFRRHWDPSARVIVSQGAVVVSSDGTSATVPVDATLDETGGFTPAMTAIRDHLSFRLQRVDGEWRIASAPNGIVLPLGYFTRLFRAVPLAFFTPDYGELVPDLRWFPAGSDASDSVVRRLLAGASPAVAAPVTATSFPVGTTLARHVRVTGAAAIVDLRFASGAPDTRTLTRIRRQLESTLMGLGVVHRVELEVAGVPRSVADAPLSPSGSSPDAPLVLRGSTFGFLSGSSITSYAKLASAVVKAKPSAVTTDDALGRAAVLTDSGDVAVLAPTGRAVVVDRRSGLIAPTLDESGWAWSVPGMDVQGLQAARGGRTVAVSSGLDAGTVSKIELSRDDTRLLMVLDSGRATQRVVVAGVLRSADGTPIGLSGTVYESPLPSPDSVVIDATWADSGSIAVLVQRSDGSEGVVLQQLGGLSSADGALSKATAIVGGATPSDLTVLAGGSVEQTSNGNTVWQSIATGIDLIAVQH